MDGQQYYSRYKTLVVNLIIATIIAFAFTFISDTPPIAIFLLAFMTGYLFKKAIYK